MTLWNICKTNQPREAGERSQMTASPFILLYNEVALTHSVTRHDFS